jgi:hypothetical protein
MDRRRRRRRFETGFRFLVLGRIIRSRVVVGRARSGGCKRREFASAWAIVVQLNERGSRLWCTDEANMWQLRGRIEEECVVVRSTEQRVSGGTMWSDSEFARQTGRADDTRRCSSKDVTHSKACLAQQFQLRPGNALVGQSKRVNHAAAVRVARRGFENAVTKVHHAHELPAQ